MKLRGAISALPVLLLVLGGPARGAPTNAPLDSSWVEMASGGLVGQVGGNPQVRVTLRSKATESAWVQVRIAAPAPNAECVLAKAISAGASESFACDQENIVPDTDYPVLVTVYRDDSLTDVAESTRTVMRFSERDAAAFAEYLAAPELPATFKDVLASENPGVGAALFGGFGGGGTLVVAQRGLQYTAKAKVTDIPVPAIRSVKIRSFANDQTKQWVTVEYAEADAVRTIGFQGSPFRGGGPRVDEIHKAIFHAWSKHPKGPPIE